MALETGRRPVAAVREHPLPKASEKRAEVQALFERIASRYDSVNRVMSLGLDRRWRRIALAAARIGAGDRVVDLACGTGDLAELAARSGARVIGVDFARAMLERATRRRVPAFLVRGDCSALPLRSGCADAAVCGFALRNFVSLDAVFAELARVLAPGGRIALLDVDRPPRGPVRAVHSLYFDQLVPRLGALLSDRDAYAYLPRSTEYLPEPSEMRDSLERAGFRAVERRTLLLGAVQLIGAIREGAR